MKEIITTGKNIEKAIEKGLEDLGAKFEDVDVEVISEGGFFSKAKVKITLPEEKDNLPKEPAYEPKNQIEEISDGVTVSIKNKNNEKKEEPKSEIKELFKEKVFINNNKPTNEFIKDVLSLANIDCTVEKTEDEQYIKYVINGENLSQVIGNKGECLSALQYIASLVKCEEDKGKKIILDAGDYKKNREEKIKELANRIITKVKETGRWEKLKPMNAYERRIVHEVVNNSEGVRGESRGEEPNRYLTIYPDNK